MRRKKKAVLVLLITIIRTKISVDTCCRNHLGEKTQKGMTIIQSHNDQEKNASSHKRQEENSKESVKPGNQKPKQH